MRGVPPVCQNWAWYISCGTLVDVHVLQKLLINPFLADVPIAFHSGSSYLNITFRRILIIKFCYQFGAPKLIIILPQKSLGSGYSYSTRYLYPPTLDRKPFLRGLYTDLSCKHLTTYMPVSTSSSSSLSLSISFFFVQLFCVVWVNF